MKLRTLVQDSPNRKLKMIISETQFRALANNVLTLQEEKQIKNTHLIKTNVKPNNGYNKNELSTIMKNSKIF